MRSLCPPRFAATPVVGVNTYLAKFVDPRLCPVALSFFAATMRRIGGAGVPSLRARACGVKSAVTSVAEPSTAERLAPQIGRL